MGRQISGCPCCGATIPAVNCCFYSEREDPDTLFVTIPSLGWDKLSHPKTAIPTLCHDRAGYTLPILGFPSIRSPIYIEELFENGMSVEVNWVNDGRLCTDATQTTNKFELCSNQSGRGFPIVLPGGNVANSKFYLSDPIFGDLQEGLDVSFGVCIDAFNTYASIARVFVNIHYLYFREPIFGFPDQSSLQYQGCGISIGVIIWNANFRDEDMTPDYVTSVVNCLHNKDISRLRCFGARDPIGLINPGLNTFGLAGDEMRRDIACDPIPGQFKLPTISNKYMIGLAYGYLKKDNNPQIPNSYHHINKFTDFYQNSPLLQQLGYFCADGFNITW